MLPAPSFVPIETPMRIAVALLFVIAAAAFAGAQESPKKSDEILRQRVRASSFYVLNRHSKSSVTILSRVDKETVI